MGGARTPPRGLTLVVLYAGFAVVATLVNLGAQRLVLATAGSGAAGFVAAVLTGTLAGLVVKYLLDKRWIFLDTATGLRAHGRRFGLYTAMGIVTTAIFWVSETAFWLTWRTEAMRELGAVLGLSVGYVTKYFLDRRFVFANHGVA
jgi:putative flippase GtrA